VAIRIRVATLVRRELAEVCTVSVLLALHLFIKYYLGLYDKLVVPKQKSG